MQVPSLPHDEEERLKTLRDMLILDTESEQRFDVLTQYAGEFFKVPIALVSLVDAERQWFKSRYGLDATETPRDISFCGHAILEQEPLVVSNALEDPRFADNPLVTGGPEIRFYAGAPLHMRNGQRIGTFCIIDSKPRELTEWEVEHLKDLAKVASKELEGIAASRGFLDANACMEFCTMGHLEQKCPYLTPEENCPQCPVQH